MSKTDTAMTTLLPYIVFCSVLKFVYSVSKVSLLLIRGTRDLLNLTINISMFKYDIFA